MAQAVSDLGLQTHAGALLDTLGRIAGLEIADIGCGEGHNARALAAAGAQVTGFDPFIETTGWVSEGTGRYRLVRASADALPLKDEAVDVALFVFSLHHVPQPNLEAALSEARRVLKPYGRLLIAEPLATGPSHYVGSPFHDETAVRAAAAAAIGAHAAPLFGEHRRLAYTERRTYTDFEGYAERMIRNRRFNGYTEEAVLAPEVRRRFDEMFASTNGAFDQPVHIDLLSEPRAEDS